MKKNILFLFIFILCNLIFFPTSANDFNYDPPTIQAPSAILMDANTGQILYEKNAHEKLYPASITKLMTALLSIESLKPNDIITFSKNSVFSIPRGSSHIGIKENEKLTVDQALHGLLLESANEVANALAEHLSKTNEEFAKKMNARAKELGVLNTHFVNPHGLHDDNHYTTAYDMAKISIPLTKNKYFLDIMKDSMYKIPTTNVCDEERIINQKHKIVSKYRDKSLYRETIIGGKNGYTKQANHTLVTMEKRGSLTLIAVVLKSTSKNVYTDTISLLDYGYNNFQYQTIETKYYEKTLPIEIKKNNVIKQLGDVDINIASSTPILMNKNINIKDIDSKVNISKKITTDLKPKEIIGTIDFYYQNNFLGKANLSIKDIRINKNISNKNLLFSFPFPIKYLYLIIILILLIVPIIYYIITKRKKPYYEYYRKRQKRKSYNYYR